ncbi:DNA-directed RNA polymerase subunit omega [Pseudobacteriovorax antillogorgiicola]|uniref:DNA-directed RNA polymerase subunit omega n=1 Tax=Pseudobacteriovorax antillogorgiicola TaxID=1513793 RepID=A0A1Y6BPJ5_9BACT|nr:DNA-directed RNA polymerase subunit omega [Pseudobacteriovorax antillogorgiicola]TCS53844.1 DNA-directed RNA polymerase subunit omega [Pseudobacteriovorax antillogorgiicola]SMF21636.1 DNA-directed RNA polymerase subunit omega [Pseudobacteriovorax antillogorgiicola]
MARVSIEDCLEHIENRFALVSVASHRTRQLMEGKAPLVKTKNKEAVTALREIAEGLVLASADSETQKVAPEMQANPLEAVLSSES